MLGVFRLATFFVVSLLAAAGPGGCVHHELLPSTWQEGKSPPPEVAAELTVRLSRATQEIASSDEHSWAGRYREGGLVSTSLVLSPSGSFVYTRQGCLGVYAWNYGSVTETDDGSLSLHYALPRNRQDQHAVENARLVRWGTRTYLIPPKKLPTFCNDINRGWEPKPEPSFSGFYLRGRASLQERQAPPTGMPEIPDEYRSLILDAPIPATITNVHRLAGSATERLRYMSATDRVTLNVGSRDGVVPGLEFEVCDERVACVLCFLKISTVGEHTAEGLFAGYGRTPQENAVPEVGWKVVARAHGEPACRILRRGTANQK